MERGCGFEFDEKHKVWVTGCGQEIRTDEEIKDLWNHCPYCGDEIVWEDV